MNSDIFLGVLFAIGVIAAVVNYVRHPSRIRAINAGLILLAGCLWLALAFGVLQH